MTQKSTRKSDVIYGLSLKKTRMSWTRSVNLSLAKVTSKKETLPDLLGNKNLNWNNFWGKLKGRTQQWFLLWSILGHYWLKRFKFCPKISGFYFHAKLKGCFRFILHMEQNLSHFEEAKVNKKSKELSKYLVKGQNFLYE